MTTRCPPALATGLLAALLLLSIPPAAADPGSGHGGPGHGGDGSGGTDPEYCGALYTYCARFPILIPLVDPVWDCINTCA